MKKGLSVRVVILFVSMFLFLSRLVSPPCCRLVSSSRARRAFVQCRINMCLFERNFFFMSSSASAVL